MNTLALSRHAETRMRQRGMRPSDLDIIFRLGSEVGDDVYVSRKDTRREIERLGDEIRRLKRPQDPVVGANIEREIRRLKRNIHVLERMKDWKVVVVNGAIVTCYRPNQRNRKRLLRRKRESV